MRGRNPNTEQFQSRFAGWRSLPGFPFSNPGLLRKLTRRDLKVLFIKEQKNNFVFDTFLLSLPPRRPRSAL